MNRTAVMLLVACAAGCGGGGGGETGPSFTPVSATKDGELYTLHLGDLKMVVDGARGARITEFSLSGTNALVIRDDSANYGSTYWPSPQSSWCAAGTGCWPAPAEIDTQAYTGAIDGTNSIQLTSGVASLGGFADSAIVVGKKFSPAPEHGAVDVTYTLTNTSTSVSVSLAPWQVTRVAAGGLTFFGQGSGDVTYAADSDPVFALTEAAGNRWYSWATVDHDSKAFADGTGWVAQVTTHALFFVLASPDVQPADAAPGEAEMELFTNRDSVYVEVEQQGAWTTLAPGAVSTWTVRWKLRPMPTGASFFTPGSADLVALASKVLAE
jgi:hypothetical protein